MISISSHSILSSFHSCPIPQTLPWFVPLLSPGSVQIPPPQRNLPWSFSLKKFTSNVQSSCILSLHFMSVWIYLIYLLDYLLIIHLLLECKLHQSSVCLVYYLCPKYPEQSWYTIEISSGLTVNEFAIICLFEIICFFCFYWDIFILERGNYNHGWMGLKDFQLFWIGSKVKKNRALEYLYYMYPHPRLILVLSYSQRGNNSPTLTRNCPKMT